MLNIVLEIAIACAVLMLMALVVLGWGRLSQRILLPKKVGAGIAGDAMVNEIAANGWFGIAALIIMLGVTHLFMPIDGKASLVIVVIGLMGWLLVPPKTGIRITKLNLVIGIVIIILLIAKAMHVPDHPDSGLYHLDSIHWITSYAIVPGLGNLHGRLAFNQSYFLLAALANAGGYYDRGYAILNVLLTILSIVSIHHLLFSRDHGVRLASWGLLIGLLYHIAHPHFSSPAPDTAISFIQLGLVAYFIEWVNVSVERTGTNATTEQSLTLPLILSIGFIGITLKLSSLIYCLFIILITLSYSYYRQGKKSIPHLIILFYGIGGFIHIARSYITSGVPLYPSTFGAIKFDWSVPLDRVKHEADVVTAFARERVGPSESVLHGWEWLGAWWERIHLGPILLLWLITLSLIAGLFVHWRRISTWFIAVPWLASLVYWFVLAPDFRLFGALPTVGCALMLMIIGRLEIIKSLSLTKVQYIGIILIFIEVTGILIRRPPHFRGWEPYPQYTYQTKTLSSGLQGYYPLEVDDFCWVSPLPCLSTQTNKNVSLRVPPSLSHGFKVQ